MPQPNSDIARDRIAALAILDEVSSMANISRQRTVFRTIQARWTILFSLIF